LRRFASSYIPITWSLVRKGQVYSLDENQSGKYAACGELAKKVENQLINYQSERHCTLSGRFLGMGSAVTYLWRQDLWAFAAASEVDELSVPSVRSRPWNFAKRLITENLSRSWHSTLRFETDALFSNLHHQWANNKTNEYISETNMFYH
jgi:hypothetical protein